MPQSLGALWLTSGRSPSTGGVQLGAWGFASASGTYKVTATRAETQNSGGLH